jgi:DNA-directed RNA polymerase I, II, and III subunit RPABC3
MACRGENFETQMVCDYNCEIYPLTEESKLEVLLTTSIADDGHIDNEYNPHLRSQLLDEYEYVMHGKVFKIKHPEKQNADLEVFISYGGLLMSLRGKPQTLDKIELDSKVYLLMRRVKDASA